MTWRDKALCFGADQDLFFPGENNNVATIAEAKRICAACPVRSDCLEYALTHRPFGIWGGTSENERRGRGARPAGPGDRDVLGVQHGTPAGARAHYRGGEKPCAACRQANSLNKALRSERNKQVAP